MAPVVHFVKCCDDGIVVAPAEAGDEGQIFCGGLFGRGQDGANAGRISGDGLFAEDVLVGIDASG